jgi:hypothetical protein
MGEHVLDAQRSIADREVCAGAVNGLDIFLVGDAADDAQLGIEAPAIGRLAR